MLCAPETPAHLYYCNLVRFQQDTAKYLNFWSAIRPPLRKPKSKTRKVFEDNIITLIGRYFANVYFTLLSEIIFIIWQLTYWSIYAGTQKQTAFLVGWKWIISVWPSFHKQGEVSFRYRVLYFISKPASKKESFVLFFVLVVVVVWACEALGDFL